MTESTERRKIPELCVPQGIIIDFDRTLGDVEASLIRLYAAAESQGLSTEPILQARRIAEEDGGSFDPLTYVRESLAPDAMAEFIREFTSADGPAILYSDAIPFLNKLQLQNIPYHVLTYGVNPEWQRLKIRASGYKGSMSVLDHTDKGKQILQWRGTNGIYTIGTQSHDEQIVCADSICLIDDKATSFVGLPPDSQGYLLQRSEVQLPSQKGELPSNVEIVRSLDELVVTNGTVSLNRTPTL